MNSTSKYKKDQISWWEKCWQQILILKSQYLCNPILQRYGIRKFKFEVKTQFIYEWFSFEVLLGYLRQFFYVYLFYLYLHTQHTPNPEAHVRDELPPKFVKINKFNQINWAFELKFSNDIAKKMSFCHKLKSSNHYILSIRWWIPLIFQIYVIWSNRIHRLKYLRSTTLGCKDIDIWNSEFVAKTQLLWDFNILGYMYLVYILIEYLFF